MSPPETLTFPSKGVNPDTPPLSLDDYAVTSNGFLPSDPPLKKLPSPYYAPWESLIESLSTSLAHKTLRHEVDQLPVLSTDHLATEQEWRRACVVLGFLAHAYIWGGDAAAEVLPPQIALPLLAVSHHHGIPPVATYASVNLWNFHPPSSSDPTDLDALHALHTFTGTPDESWFYMVSVAMEARGAYLIPLMLRALDAVRSRQHQTVASALEEMASCIGALGILLDRMDERCSPQVFYHRIRPFLAGSKNMAAAGLPRGVFYDEGSGRGEWRQLRGGSNGQSSLVQFLDVVLGVEHAATGSSTPDTTGRYSGSGQRKLGQGQGPAGVSFHQEVRGYMPAPHRRLLEDVAARYPGGMRKGVGELLAVGEGEEGLSEEQVAVREAFQAATGALAEFRNKHLQMVTRYIIIPSRQPNWCQGVNLATASSKVKGLSATEGRAVPAGGGELTGTGGTALLPFLKQSRDETFQAGRLQVR
ncbi:Indoleamine 2,3-dioxygenase [Parachaetomium inaequale]|uniref:Indoleamine 2,3-dioxygenase n=1 Tax=Parachaetomium inaequale TaxID=2588326 RepID=A0AAN6PG39_9PEZI|nr:Indoleamine 2,3-dioxygenase [Parachaetomium inaequale]